MTDRTREALAELVACKDLKAHRDSGIPWPAFKEADAEYHRRQPLAWEAARAALADPPAPTGEPYVEEDGCISLDWQSPARDILSISIDEKGHASFAWRTADDRHGSGVVDLQAGTYKVLRAVIASEPDAKPASTEPSPRSAEAGSTETLSKESAALIFHTLQFFANVTTYQGERIGGILQGCPRGPTPTPYELADEARRVLNKVEAELRAAALAAPVQSGAPAAPKEPKP